MYAVCGVAGGSNTELWNYGPDVLHRINNTHNLRYRMLPYTYSGFFRVYEDGYTMQRALVFDFAYEPLALRVADQFMWGPALLVAPIVTDADNQRRARNVFVPAVDGGWVDFWSGTGITGPSGAHVISAPIDHIPTLVRAGSIVVLGPLVQNTVQQAVALEVRIYPGAPGSFVLIEDDGVSGAYARGAVSRIVFEYNNATRTLDIAARTGTYAGMLARRSLYVVLVSPEYGVGLEVAHTGGQHVDYTGAPVRVAL